MEFITASHSLFSMKDANSAHPWNCYCLPGEPGYEYIPTIYKSIPMEVLTGLQPAHNRVAAAGPNGQGMVSIWGSSQVEVILADWIVFKTTNGGSSWSQISSWVGTGGPYVHTDQHNIQWLGWRYETWFFGCGGGVHYSHPMAVPLSMTE